MGVTVFTFTYDGDTDQFLERVHSWMATTTEGRRYRITDSTSGSIMTIKRGKGFLTAPIIFEFYTSSFLGFSAEVIVRGYVRAFAIGGIKWSLSQDSLLGGIPRRNGWEDMMKMLDFVGIAQYQHRFE